MGATVATLIVLHFPAIFAFATWIISPHPQTQMRVSSLWGQRLSKVTVESFDTGDRFQIVQFLEDQSPYRATKILDNSNLF